MTNRKMYSEFIVFLSAFFVTLCATLFFFAIFAAWRLCERCLSS